MAIITVSNDNKNRVDAAIDKQTGEVLDLLTEASTLLHDTGDTESETLDNAMTHLRCAVDMLVRYRENELG